MDECANGSGMPAEYEAELLRVTRKVARAYAVRCKAVDERDAAQEAARIGMTVYARGGWRGGVRGFGTLVYVAVNRQLPRYLLRAQKPVSCRSDHSVPRLREVVQQQAPWAMPWAEAIRHTLQGKANADQRDVYPRELLREVDEVYDREASIAELRAKIRRRLYQLVGRTPAARAAVLSWLDGFEARDAARGLCATPDDVYYINSVLKKCVTSDRRVRELAAQLAEERGWCRTE